MPKYIIESHASGINWILALQDDGTYRAIAQCVGEFGNVEVADMVKAANRNENCGLCE